MEYLLLIQSEFLIQIANFSPFIVKLLEMCKLNFFF